MNSCELILFISNIACIIAKSYSTEDAELLAAIFSQLGDSITTVLAATPSATDDSETCQSQDESST